MIISINYISDIFICKQTLRRKKARTYTSKRKNVAGKCPNLWQEELRCTPGKFSTTDQE